MERSWNAWCRLLEGRTLPAAVVDLDAVDQNLGVLLGARQRDGVTLRLATKSLRIPVLMRWILERAGGEAVGLMPYAAEEALWLASEGWTDLLMGYPVGTRTQADSLVAAHARGGKVVATVDCTEQVEVLEAAAREAGVRLSVCIDIDLSLQAAGGRVHLGVRRSAIRDAATAVALGRRIRQGGVLALDAVLAYEAQVAGLADRAPGERWQEPVRRWLKRRSVALAAERRASVVEALRADGHTLRIVNGGGSGSVGSTSADPTVTEVTAGSGFLCSHLFDHYHGLPLRPAAFFALPVVRRSGDGFVTCLGGGYTASGAMGADRLPRVHLPQGLVPVDLEGWGEVQTPFRIPPGMETPPLGAPILARHAKAGELFERFATVLLVRAGAVVDEVPTYRGSGCAFG